MLGIQPPRARYRALCIALATVVLSVGGSRVALGQELPIKTTVPGAIQFTCPAQEAPRSVSDEERSQAAQLSSSASEALILGDQQRARDLLTRAVELNPASPDLVFRLARVRDDLNEMDAAVTTYCRALSLGQEQEVADEIQRRIEALTARDETVIPDAAASAFRNGVLMERTGWTEDAFTSFSRAVSLAPDWADAHYNLGVILVGLHRRAAAQQELRRYLELAPDASDAFAVSELIGRMETATVGNQASPPAALGLGLIPGMGQVYTARPGLGIGFLALAGASTASAFFIERGRGRRFFKPGLAMAGTITAIGAIEAFMTARRWQLGPDAPMPKAGAAFGAGLIPGMGQYYEGRPVVGLAFTSMVGGLIAASDLAEDGTDRRFVTPGLYIAAGVGLIGATEAAIMARRARLGDPPPNPANALGLGVIPGMGQFYSGRPAAGLGVLAVAAGGLAGSFLYEEGEGRGFFRQGFIIAGAATALGAVEAYFHARGMARGAPGGGGDAGAAPAASGLRGPALTTDGERLQLRLLGWRF